MIPNASSRAFVGAGIGYRRLYRRDLLSAQPDARPAVLEVVPGHFFSDPERLAELAELYPLVFHEVACSVGTAEGSMTSAIDRQVLGRVRSLMEHARPLFFTEHLALTTSPQGLDLGHLAPLWYTRDLLRQVSSRVRRWQDELGVDVALETITAPFTIPEADFSETEFFHRLVEATGCGLLLDVTNQVINAHNLGFDPLERLAAYPLHAVWQVHLAGGQTTGEHWVDSHDAPVPDAAFELLAALRGKSPLRTVIVERDGNFPPLAELLSEVERAHAVWNESSSDDA